MVLVVCIQCLQSLPILAGIIVLLQHPLAILKKALTLGEDGVCHYIFILSSSDVLAGLAFLVKERAFVLRGASHKWALVIPWRGMTAYR
jgi:hypothetical protein